MRRIHRKRFAGPDRRSRRGAILVLAAFMMVMILAFAAFTVDVGWIALTKVQLQNVADSAALAAAMELTGRASPVEAEANARQAAVDIAARHKVGERDSHVLDPQADVVLGHRLWDPLSETYSYQWGAPPYNCVKVIARRAEVEKIVGGEPTTEDRRLPLFFAPVIGHDKATMSVSAVASFQIRDMMLVLDYSSSMNDDSEFLAFSRLGRAAVEENIRQMWEDLGSPLYGRLPYEPAGTTLSGQPASGAVPHIDVTYLGTEIAVVSTKDLSNVVLRFSNGRTLKFDGLSGQTGTFRGTGSSGGKEITTAWIKSGNNASGDGPGYGERFEFNTTTIKKALGLDRIPYPYAGGGWDEYINYAMSAGSRYYPSQNADAGYRYRFGMKNLINYWNEYRPLSSETDLLWMTRQQPITALKDATDLLLDYLIAVDAEDFVGLSVYTYPDADGAKLERPLSTDYSQLQDISRHRQAGHYDHYTNIGAGIRNGRLELERNGRPAALRMIVLMTDGQANRSLTGADPKQFALDEAQLCKDAGIEVVTVSLGVGADRDLMQQIADLTGGEHFNVPGGAGVAEYEAELKEVFREIAADRPLKLVGAP